jgi:hypothetical protein
VKSSTAINNYRDTPGARLFSRERVILPSIAPLVLCLAFFWPFGAGHKVHLMSGTATPGARGTADIQSGDNGNTQIDLKVRALAPPATLTPAENVYVVWIEAPGHAPQNHGQIRVNGKEQGELHTDTPYKRFQIFVTAEATPRTVEPEGPRVLRAAVSRS